MTKKITETIRKFPYARKAAEVEIEVEKINNGKSRQSIFCWKAFIMIIIDNPEPKNKVNVKSAILTIWIKWTNNSLNFSQFTRCKCILCDDILLLNNSNMSIHCIWLDGIKFNRHKLKLWFKNAKMQEKWINELSKDSDIKSPTTILW